MNKLESIPSIFEKIPTPIIYEILARLPTKSCWTSKFVCKEWYSIITSIEFAALRSSRCPFFAILLYGKFHGERNDFLLLDLDNSLKVDELGNLNISSDVMIKFKSEFTIPYHDELIVINECNGLICLKSYGEWTPFIICNLLTGEQVIVNQVPKASYMVKLCGLGCCPVSSQFKVLRLLKKWERREFEAQVCTLGTNEWRVVCDALPCQVNGETTFLHGSLHVYSYIDNSIWSLHFGSEQFSLFPGPDCLKIWRPSYLSTFESCLSFCYIPPNDKCEIWVMKEYKVRDSWMKLFVFDAKYERAYMPLFQIDDTNMLVSNMYGHCLGITDIESGKSRRTQVFGFNSLRVLRGDVKFSKL